MYCSKCGASNPDHSKFCSGCGFDLTPQSVTASPHIPPLQPPQPPVYAQPVYAGAPQPYAPPIKRKGHVGLWITIIILLSVIAAGVWFVCSIFAFKPKDLGVTYTDADYQSALAKTGVEITFDGMSGEALEAYKDTLGDTKLNIQDYKWEFSDFQPKSFTLTPAEATAFLNEIAPAFWWFDNLQVKAYPDGTMEGSSTADIARLKTDLYSDVAAQVPIPLPDNVNIYSKGVIGIANNRLTGNPQAFEVGFVPLPNEYMIPESVDIMASYFERIYTIIPGLAINTLTSDGGGNFVFDGVIPQQVSVTSMAAGTN